MALRFFINNIEFGGPKEWRGTEVEINFESESPSAIIAGDKFTFVTEAATILNQWVTDGFIFEGVPYRIMVDNERLFDGYINLAGEGTEFSCDEVKAEIVDTSTIEWLNDVADGFTMDSLYFEDGIITDSDIVDVPCVVSEIPDYLQSFTAFIGAYTMVQEIRNIISQLQSITAEASNPISAISAVIKFVFLIAYLSFVAISIIILFKQFVTSLIQPIKYHRGLYVKTMVERSCQKLNLQLVSTGLLDDPVFSKLFVLSKRLSKGRVFKKSKKSKGDNSGLRKLESLILGRELTAITQIGTNNKTFGDILRDLQTMFKASIHIVKRDSGKDLLYIVPDRFEINSSTFQLKDLYTEFSGTNANEMISNYLIEYTLDPSDYNTLSTFEHTSVQVTTKQKSMKNGTPTVVLGNSVKIPNPQFRLLRGYEGVLIPYARAVRKNELTFIEQIVNVVSNIVKDAMTIMIGIYNAAIATINGVIKFVNLNIRVINSVVPPLLNTKKPIPLIKLVPKKTVDGSFQTTDLKREGALLISNDTFSQDKIMILVNGKIDPRSEEYLSPINLYNRYHKQAVSFIPSIELPNANQYLTYSVDNHPFCVSDFLLIKRNKNRIFSANGEVARIDSLKWNPATNLADVSYRVNRRYTDNLTQTIIIDGNV